MKIGHLIATIPIASLYLTSTAHAVPRVVPEIDAGMAGSAIPMFIGTLAGMGYALMVAHRGRLTDAIMAHMTTSRLIAAYVLFRREWSLWA